MAIIRDHRKITDVVLSLGGNEGDVLYTFSKALEALNTEVGNVKLLSSVYETAAWGNEDQPNFLNQVLLLKTSIGATEVLARCMDIEKRLGRKREGEKWGRRVIDIDVLFYGDETIDTIQLKVPHPFIQQRNFILTPLIEIIPNFIHSTLGKTMVELQKECKDELSVIKRKDSG